MLRRYKEKILIVDWGVNGSFTILPWGSAVINASQFVHSQSSDHRAPLLILFNVNSLSDVFDNLESILQTISQLPDITHRFMIELNDFLSAPSGFFLFKSQSEKILRQNFLHISRIVIVKDTAWYPLCKHFLCQILRDFFKENYRSNSDFVYAISKFVHTFYHKNFADIIEQRDQEAPSYDTHLSAEAAIKAKETIDTISIHANTHSSRLTCAFFNQHVINVFVGSSLTSTSESTQLLTEEELTIARQFQLRFNTDVRQESEKPSYTTLLQTLVTLLTQCCSQQRFTPFLNTLIYYCQLLDSLGSLVHVSNIQPPSGSQDHQPIRGVP